MNFKYLTLFLLIGCGAFNSPDETTNTDRTQYKTHIASQSCDQLKIPGDIAFNGYFLYHFLLCSSDKTQEQQETLNGLSSVVQTMKVQGMDNMTSLLKENPIASSKEKKYPLIRALLILLERGVYRDGQVVFELQSRRFGELQELLLKLTPYRPIDLILDMNRTETFKALLNQLEKLLTDIDNQTLLSLLRSVLEDEKMRKATAVLLDRLAKTKFYLAWKDILDVDAITPLSVDAISLCLSHWADPQITKEELSCHQNGYLKNSQEYPVVSFQKLLTNLGNKKINALIIFLHSLFSDFLKASSSDRVSVLMRLSHAIKSMASTHQSPLRTFFSRINYFTKRNEDGRYEVDSRHSDILMTTLADLVEYAGSEIGQVVNSKLGIVKLEETIVELLFHGGKIKGCDLVLPGLKDTDMTERKAVFFLIYRYLSANPSCRQGISPMASHSLAILQEHLGVHCRDKSTKKLCPSEENMKQMALLLQRVKWDDLAFDRIADPSLVKKILLETLDEVGIELLKDSHYLYWLHLAKGEVASQIIEKLRNRVRQKEDFSPKGMAHLDREIMELDEFDILQRDFLENLLHFKINRLSAVLEQFDGIMKQTKDANIKLERILYGIYNQGPLEQLIHPRLYLGKLPGKIEQSIPITPRIKDILFQLRKEGMLFKNKYFSKGHRVSFPWIGTVSHSSRLIYETRERTNFSFFKGIKLARGPFSFADYF